MEENKQWLKFIITGKVDDYLAYKTYCKEQEMLGGVDYSLFDGRPCNKGSKYRG